MAMTAEEKRAYNKEYYEKYRKKGQKKGRKKGTSKKKSSTANIVGLSTAGLNDAGKMEVALVKEDLKKKLNEELKGAKTDAEKAEIKRKYQQQALEAVQKIKGDSKYAKPKAQKAAKATSSKASSGSKSSKSSSSKKSSGTAKTSSSTTSQTSSQVASLQKNVETLTSMMTQLTEKIASMTDEQKAETKTVLTDLVAELKKQLTGGTSTEDVEKLEQELKDKLQV